VDGATVVMLDGEAYTQVEETARWDPVEQGIVYQCSLNNILCHVCLTITLGRGELLRVMRVEEKSEEKQMMYFMMSSSIYTYPDVHRPCLVVLGSLRLIL